MSGDQAVEARPLERQPTISARRRDVERQRLDDSEERLGALYGLPFLGWNAPHNLCVNDGRGHDGTHRHGLNPQCGRTLRIFQYVDHDVGID